MVKSDKRVCVTTAEIFKQVTVLGKFGGLLYCMLILFGFGVLASGCSDRADTEKLILEGGEALAIFDFTRAYTAYSNGFEDVPRDQANWDEIAYAYAIAAWHKSPPSRQAAEVAETLFLELSESKNDIIAYQSKYNLGRIYEILDYPGDLPRVEDAIEVYRGLIASETPGDIRTQATLRLAQVWLQDFEPEGILAAKELLVDYLESPTSSEWESLVWQYLGDIYAHLLGNTESGLDAYYQAFLLGFANESLADTYIWRMIEWSQALGRDQLADELAREIINYYPRSTFGSMAEAIVEERERR